MKLIFSGDSIIRIVAEVIEVTLDDQVYLGTLKISQNIKFYNVNLFYEMKNLK